MPDTSHWAGGDTARYITVPDTSHWAGGHTARYSSVPDTVTGQVDTPRGTALWRTQSLGRWTHRAVEHCAGYSHWAGDTPRGTALCRNVLAPRTHCEAVTKDLYLNKGLMMT